MAQYLWWTSEVWTGETSQGVMFFFKGFGGAEPNQLREEVRLALRDSMFPVDAFVVYCCSYEFEETAEILASSSLISDFELLGERPMQLVALSASMTPTKSMPMRRQRTELQGSGWWEDAATFDRAWLDGMQRLIERGAVVLEAPAGYHFRKTSTRCSKHFIRAENASLNGPEASFIGLALMRRLSFSTVKRIHIDSVTILAVALSAATHAILFKVCEVPPRIESFHSWDGVDGLGTFSNDGADFVLISASSSSGLSDAVKKRTGLSANLVVTLFSFADSSESVLFKIAPPVNFTDGEMTEHPNDALNGSIPMRVVGEHFLFEHKKPRLVRITMKHKASAQELSSMLAIQSLDIFRAHQPTQGANKLRRISLAPRIFQLEDVRTAITPWIESTIERAELQSEIAVVVVGGANATDLAALVTERLRVAGLRAKTAIPAEDVTVALTVDAEQPIIVVCDAVGSGHALVALSAELRQIQPRAKIIYVVAFHLSPSLPIANLLKISLERSWKDGMYQYHVWWPASVGEEPMPTIARALQILDLNAIESLAADSDETIPFLRHTDAHNLTQNAVFLPPDYDAATFNRSLLHLAFCSVLQRARDASNLPLDQTLRSSEFEQVLIDADSFSRFSDNSIRASLLWAARPSEIDYQSDANSSSLMTSTIIRWSKSKRAPDRAVVADFVLALLSNHLRLVDGDLVRLRAELRKYVPEKESALNQLTRLFLQDE